MADERRPFVLAVGDSLTAGYRLKPEEAFPARLERLLAELHPCAAVLNAGVSGDTTAAALVRLPRILSSLSRIPDLAIVSLGANDLLRGLPLAATRHNLDMIVAELGRCGIPVLLAAMAAPRFLGRYASACDQVYNDVAVSHGAFLWPFFPPGVLGGRGLTLPDGIHPNAAAIARIAEHMLPAVIDALSRRDVREPSVRLA